MKIELCVSLVAELTITIDPAANVRPQERREDLVIRGRDLAVVSPDGAAIDTPLRRRRSHRPDPVAWRLRRGHLDPNLWHLQKKNGGNSFDCPPPHLLLLNPMK